MADPIVVEQQTQQQDKQVVLHNVPPFSRDIRLILNKYIDLNTVSLRDFKILWKSLKFSYIHEGRPDEVNYETYIQEVFTTCIGYLIFNQETKLSQKEIEDLNLSDQDTDYYPLNFRIRVGVIYLLYFLYCTQPKTIQSASHKQKPVQIKISIDAFKELVNMMEQFIEKDLTEPYIVLSRLRSLSAFEYCAMTYVDPVMSSLKDPNDNLEEELVSDEVAKIATTSHIPKLAMEELKQVAVDYQTVKEDIVKGIERSSDNITHQHTVIGQISVAKSLGLCKSEFVDELKSQSNSLVVTDELKITQFLDKWENDPSGSSLIKKKRRKKRVKKKDDDTPKVVNQTTKKPPSKVSIEVSKAVNDYIATSFQPGEEEPTKKKKKAAPKRKKDQDEENEEPKKKKSKKKESTESSEKKTKKKSKKKDDQIVEEEAGEPKKKKSKKKDNEEEPKKKKSKKKAESEDESDQKTKKKKSKKKESEKKTKSSSKKKDTSKKKKSKDTEENEEAKETGLE